MTHAPQEAAEFTTRLLKSTLETDHCRAYWAHAISNQSLAVNAFASYWFGARSFARVQLLLANMRARFDAFPPALEILHRWTDMSPDTRRALCHWHLQLADPLYRRFTGGYLVERRASARPEVTRDLVVRWIGETAPGRWAMSTRLQFAGKLLSASRSAGLLASHRDPRPLTTPSVPDDALAYLMYLLRGIEFQGTLLENPYSASVGLHGAALETRLARLPGLQFKRQGDLVDFGWHYRDLRQWGQDHFANHEASLTGVAR